MERLVRALRRVRAVTSSSSRAAFVDAVLDVVLQETSAERLILKRGGEEDVVVGEKGERPADELWVEVGDALLLFELPEAAADAHFAEILGAAALLRVELDRVEREARAAARQLALLDRVTRARAGAGEGEGEGEVTVAELADRAAREVGVGFSTIGIGLHVVVDDRLELVARRMDDGASHMDEAPEWLRSIALDSHLLQAVAARQKRIVTKMIAELGEISRRVMETRGAQRLVVAPLIVGEKLVGTMSLMHRKTDGEPDHLDVISGVATRLAVDLAQAQQLEEAQQRSRDLELITEIGSLVARQRDVEAVFTTVVTELARVADVPRVCLLLVDAERRFLNSVACTQDLHPKLAVGVEERATSSHAFRTAEPVVVEDVSTDPRASPEIAKLVGARSTLAVPLIINGEVIGVILLAEQRRVRKFSRREVARFSALANILSPVIANATMFEDLRQSYEALARAQADLVTHERLAALGELSAVIAHEVRNPLGVIYNSLGALRRLSQLRGDAGLLLDIVEEEAARLNRIVADLLDFVRPYSSHPRALHPEVLVRGAIEGARRANARSAVMIETKLDLGADPVVLDGTMVEQALTNLVVNAIQATPSGGTVMVSARNERSNTGPRLRLEVADEGPGVDDADATHIFQPFYTTKAAGTGLGLAVVRRIADALGGNVVVARGERGAIFTLTVPLVSAT